MQVTTLIILFSLSYPPEFSENLPRKESQEQVEWFFTKREEVSALDTTNIKAICEKFKISEYSILEIKASKIQNSNNQKKTLEFNKYPAVKVLTTIAKPQAFERNLVSIGLKIKQSHHFPDHYKITKPEFEKIRAENPDLPIVCTLKDIVKNFRLD